MKITVSKSGEQFGPFTMAEINARLLAGELKPNDWAWQEGSPDWVPLSSVAGIGSKPAVAPGVASVVPAAAKTMASNIPATTVAQRASVSAHKGSAMKGTVLDFSIQTGEGIISGDDNVRYKFAGAEWKASGAPTHGHRVDFEITEGRATGVYLEPTKTSATPRATQALDTDFSDLSPYYQKEFKRLLAEGKNHDWRWNWSAFLFGPLWAMTKQLWLSVVVWLVIGLVTAGIGFFVAWFVYGARGNYMYFMLHTKKKQLWA